MASPTRQEKSVIESRLGQDPFGFDFYQAIRLLEGACEELPRMGYSLTPADDPLRFGQAASLSFAPSTIESFQLRDGLARMIVHCFGLLGPNGPMPIHLTEYARDRQYNNQDATLVEFLNVLHHRFISLFYRAWAVNRKAVDYDRPAESQFARYIGTLFGTGSEFLQNRDAIPDWSKLYFSGHLVPSNRNAEGLASILADFFGLPASVEAFWGRWIPLPLESQLRVGESPSSGLLGLTTCVGARIWDCQLSFRLKFGPMTLAELQRLLPDGESFLRVRTWVRNYVGDEFFWDLQLILKAAEVPRTCLGGGSQLGWTSWLRDAPFTRDADSLILQS